MVGFGLVLAFPAGRVLDLPWSRQAREIPLDRAFPNPGPLIHAHQPFEDRCRTCHEVALQHVRDRTCLECHHSLTQHVSPQRRPATLFGGSACTECHVDHKGPAPMHREDDSACVDCHRSARTHMANAGLPDVEDFADSHPDFTPRAGDPQGMRHVGGAPARLEERTGLRFAHADHLGAVRQPRGRPANLDCASCHETDGRGDFEPVSMERHCGSCHGLRFDRAAPELPHGDPARAAAAIRAFYGKRGTARARRTIAALFDSGPCAACHAASPQGDGWRVEPVATGRHWLPRARFDHRPHAEADCRDCHAVAQSRHASDVAMPGIATCRECHAGSRPVEGKVTSNCLLCHGFHESRHPWDPAFRPRGARLAEGDPAY